MTAHTDYLTAAIAYIERGMYVLPLVPGQKEPFAPLAPHGFKSATTDRETVKRWWTQHPDCNIGIACGSSGIVAVDVDPRNGGDETLAKLEALHGPLTSSVHALTGGGGQHIIYRAEPGLDLPGKAGEGIDLKASGYIVAPPSLHPSGKRYAWADGCSPADGCTPSPMPDWLRSMARKPRPAPEPVVRRAVGGDADHRQLIADLRGALEFIDSTDRDSWVSIGHALKCLGDDGFSLWLEWSQPSPAWRAGDEKQWAGFKPQHTSHKAVFTEAQRNGWRNPAKGTAPHVTARDDFAGQLGRTFTPLDTGEWNPVLLAAAEADAAVPGEVDLEDNHRNVPKPSPDCLYGLVGDVARTAHAANREVNQYAAAASFMVALSAGLGRGCFLNIGDDFHHPRAFVLHVGRSGRGRKGTSTKLTTRIVRDLKERHPDVGFQDHNGGLSSREGLVMMIHDGYKEGKNEVAPIVDKRLLIIESEFANVLHQSSRDGNTLSAALRDAWDGQSIKPAVKTNPVHATRPHINLMGHITPSELLELMKSRELTNGFANRFMMIWAEQSELDPFPSYTPKDVLAELTDRMADVLRFAKADRWVDRDQTRMQLSPDARKLYSNTYRNELQERNGGESVAGLLTRRAPYLLRLAMLFALTDKSHTIEKHHLEVALCWVRYWSESVRYIFASAKAEAEAEQANDAAEKIVAFLTERDKATRTEITKDCFKCRETKSVIDAAIQELLQANPPLIEVATLPRKSGTGSGTKIYRKTAAKSANSANSGSGVEVLADLGGAQSLQTLQTLGDRERAVNSAKRDFAPDFADFAEFANSEKAGKSEAQHHSLQTLQSLHGFSEKTVSAGDDDDCEVM